MKKLMILLLILIVCLTSWPLFAPTDKCPELEAEIEWLTQELADKEALLNLYRSKIDEVIAALEADKEMILLLQAEIAVLTEELNDKDMLIAAYREALTETEQLLEHQTGWYVGGNVTYPWGGEAMAQYKFKRWGPYILGGYTQDFHIGLGVLIKVGK